jgi:hypothetical protein
LTVDALESGPINGTVIQDQNGARFDGQGNLIIPGWANITGQETNDNGMTFESGATNNSAAGFVGNGVNLINIAAARVASGVNLTNATDWGTHTNNAWAWGTNGFYTSIGTPWTNLSSRRGWIRIPFSYSTSAGGGWNVQMYITNYSGGAIGAAGTTTNVSAVGLGAGGLSALTASGSNYLTGWVASNSVVLLTAPVGTVAVINVTNNQSSIDWQ